MSLSVRNIKEILRMINLAEMVHALIVDVPENDAIEIARSIATA